MAEPDFLHLFFPLWMEECRKLGLDDFGPGSEGAAVLQSLERIQTFIEHAVRDNSEILQRVQKEQNQTNGSGRPWHTVVEFDPTDGEQSLRAVEGSEGICLCLSFKHHWYPGRRLYYDYKVRLGVQPYRLGTPLGDLIDPIASHLDVGFRAAAVSPKLWHRGPTYQQLEPPLIHPYTVDRLLNKMWDYRGAEIVKWSLQRCRDLQPIGQQGIQGTKDNPFKVEE